MIDIKKAFEDSRTRYIAISVIAVVILVVITVVNLGNGRSQTTNNNSTTASNSLSADNANDNTDDTAQSNSSNNSDKNKAQQSTNTSYLTTNSQPHDNQGGNLHINDIKDTVKNLPDSEIKALQSALYYTVIKNTNQDVMKINDAKIRSGSYQQSFDNKNYAYNTTFLIDIPSLQQTYQAKNFYRVTEPGENDATDYNSLVLCPDKSQLIWPDFPCMDRIKQEQGQ